ncbi:hypothetical protein PTKIN_Ptkin14bG0078700 [Pterospermum kingtungense]
MIDATSRGALMNKTFKEGRNLIANMAANFKQFGFQLDMPAKHVNEGYIKKVNAVSGFPEQPQWKYDLYLTTYNSGWKDHSSLGYGNPQIHNRFDFSAECGTISS